MICCIVSCTKGRFVDTNLGVFDHVRDCVASRDKKSTQLNSQTIAQREDQTGKKGN